MPSLNAYFVLYTDGTSPHPAVHRDFKLTALPSVPVPEANEEFFGPFAQVAREQIQRARAAFLLQGHRQVRGSVGEFFSQAHAELAQCVEGLAGFAVDLLKLWALPFADISELPTDPLAEDLFAISFQEKERGRFSARTFGLAKLDQPEVTFDFQGDDLTDEAAMMCAHLADYAMTQSRRVEPGQSMTFGYDALWFQDASGEEVTASFAARVLGGAHRPTQLLRAGASRPMSTEPAPDLTEALRRSFEQRMLLEEYEVPGDSPHQTTVMRLCACAAEGLRGWREEPASAKESGWTFSCRRRHVGQELAVLPLGLAVQRHPQIFRYLALPPGSSLEWHNDRVMVDAAGQRGNDDEPSGPGLWRNP
jgi:hypothetical protein